MISVRIVTTTMLYIIWDPSIVRLICPTTTRTSSKSASGELSENSNDNNEEQQQQQQSRLKPE